jgi:hypothetical protein
MWEKNSSTHRREASWAGNPPKGDPRVRARRPSIVVMEEIRRLGNWGDRHRRLVARILIALGLTLLVDSVGTVAILAFEHGVKGGDIHSLGDALFFSTVQLLTVSSQIRNPLTAGGRIVDVGLEIWALFVVTAIAGSFAAFFASGDP